MKIHYVELRNFRGVSQRRIDFADSGVTIVEGANEAGKTSMVEAIDLLLDEPDTSTKRGVKAVQPTHIDVGAEVEAKFNTGPYRFVYRKRWHKRPETTLRILEPVPEQLAGRVAHDRVRTILEETLDDDLWAALRVEQKEPVDQVALGGNDRLAQALDAASGGARETGRESALFERAEQEYLTYFTPKGKPTGTYRVSNEELKKAETDVAAAEAAIREVDRDVEQHADLLCELVTLDKARVDNDSDLAELNMRWEALEEQQRQIDQLRLRAERAAQAAEVARAAHERREELIGKVNTAAAELSDLQRESGLAAPSLRTADELVRNADDALVAARKAAERADADARRASDDVAYLRDQADLAELTDRQERAAQATSRIEDAERFLATCPLDETLLAELEDTHLAMTRTQAAMLAMAPQVVVEPLTTLEVLVGEERLRLAPGQEERRTVTEALELALPGMLRVHVVPGAGDRDPRIAAQEAAHLFRTLCDKAQVTDIVAARALHQRRRDTEQSRDADQDTLAQALKEQSTETIRQEIARLSPASPTTNALDSQSHRCLQTWPRHKPSNRRRARQRATSTSTPKT